jgi:hypothetical protein
MEVVHRSTVHMRLTTRLRKGSEMTTERRSVRVIGTALAVGAWLGAAAAPAVASPTHPTPEEITFLNVVRGTFPGDDHQLVTVGEQVCMMLAYRMVPPADLPGHLANQYGASPEQAANLVNAAHGIICPYLPRS